MIRILCELGRNVAAMRKRAGLTQSQLAVRLSALGWSVSPCVVSNWERGIVDLPSSILPDLCRTIHCTSWQLYPHSDTISDRDAKIISIIKSMSEDEKDDLYYLLNEWQGDRKALLKLDVLHAVQSKDLRMEADRMIIRSYIEQLGLGGSNIDKRVKVDLDYVLRASRRLLDD